MQLGQEVLRGTTRWRVVRIVYEQDSLFRNEAGVEYILRESYCEIKSAAGDIDHVLERATRQPYLGPISSVVPLAPIKFLEQEVDRYERMASGRQTVGGGNSTRESGGGES